MREIEVLIDDAASKNVAGGAGRAGDGGWRCGPQGNRRSPASFAAAVLVIASAAGTAGCVLDERDGRAGRANTALSADERSAIVDEVRGKAAEYDVTPIPPAPPVSDELFELGRFLAFDKILSGNRNIACMSCHDPSTDTDDDRHLALGEGGVGLGHGRVGGGVEPRNSQPLFNLHALDRFFWDMRVELDRDVAGHGHFDTPAGEELTPEMTRVLEFGAAAAQAMFPVVSRLEMRGQRFTNAPNDNELGGDLSFQEIWQRLMDRLGAIPEYVAMFEAAYPDTDFEDMTFAHAANAIAGFEIRAFEARGSSWQRFLEGDDAALSDSALRGARDFFAAGCASCHSGPMLTDELAHNTALAQFGAGKGDGEYDNDDFGRAGTSSPFSRGRQPGTRHRPAARCGNNNPHDLYAFRTAPLVNVTLTGPWGHTGQFSDLRDFVEHYEDPEGSLRSYRMDGQVHLKERTLLEARVHNTEAVLSCLDPDTEVQVADMDDMMAFLESLTDPASRDLGWTVPSEVPSGLPVSDGVAPEIGGQAGGTVTFNNLAGDPDSGLDSYQRVPSARSEVADVEKERSLREPMQFPDLFDTPLRWRGMPGVAIFDHDGDGDQDVFATNGPGAPSSLFTNQLAETGETRFVDRAADAGVATTATDSSGTCYGDIDNDGDHDLYVVADTGRSHLFRNDGDGAFTDISDISGATPDGTGGTSCAFGDINGDGLLDLLVGRSWHQRNQDACFLDPFGSGIQHNELYVNTGAGRFDNVSATSGILDVGGLPVWAEGAPTITWAVSMVDYDLDGDVDILTADDQCGLPNAKIGGISRGFLQIFDNDGTGHFTNRTVEAGTNDPSAWMGLSFGDFNSDGRLDFFSPSFGDWGKPFAGAPVIVGDETSRWYLGAPGKTFVNPGVGALKRMPFGWGTSARDFDNDADTDISFHGGLSLWFIVDSSNPGSLLLNDGDANFGLDRAAFAANHSRRNDSGTAAGDLNGDGFADVVTVSNFDIPAPVPLTRYGAADNEVFYFSQYDSTAYFTPVFELIDPPEPGADDPRDPFEPTNKGERKFAWNEDVTFPDGTITVELNSADNGNGWVSLELVGAVGLTPGGEVNRDAIGAVLTFTPEGGAPVMAPVLGGASHLSQDTLIQGFGLGQASRGTVDILWPGGTRNRLYDIEHASRLRVPELPCSYDTTDDRATYEACVDDGLAELADAGLADASLRARMRTSALRAYDDAH